MSSPKTYEPQIKRLALALWITFSVLSVGAMAVPLYVLRDALVARTDYLILLPLLFLYATWAWLRYAYGVGKRIKNLPVRPNS
jgi:hypothetical protein